MSNTDHFQNIYATQAVAYDHMVSREDYQGLLLPTLQSIHPLNDATVVEFGAGTGRLTRLLAPHVRRIHAFDNAYHMLANARIGNQATVTLAAADNRQMPVRSKTADVTIAGWSFGHSVGWYPYHWMTEIGRALAEMNRITRQGGTLIILETLGTGFESPTPPEILIPYYRWLEDEHHFQTTWIRTDYQFASVKEAESLTRFFFGDELADRMVRDQITILPECTGIWWTQKS